MSYQFEGKNPVTLEEAAKAFNEAENALEAIKVGIQPDNRKAKTNDRRGRDPLASMLINNGVAQAAQITLDTCGTGKNKWVIQTPYLMRDEGLENTDASGDGCCVNVPSVSACRYKMGIDELCVKDCIESSLDEMIESVVKVKDTDTQFPFRTVGDSLKQVRTKYVAMYARFIFERNAMLGTPTFSGQGLRPFNGLVSRLADSRTFNVDGSAGFIAATEMLACRLAAMGKTLGDYVIAVNPIAMPSLRQEVATYLKSSPFTGWRLDANGNPDYNGIRIVTSKYVDVDLANNTTSMWLVDPSEVGIKMVRPINDPYIKPKDSAEDCGGSCITMHNAGTTVVTDWSGLMLVSNVALNAICDSSSLSGLENFVNAGVNGYLFPAQQ